MPNTYATVDDLKSPLFHDPDPDLNQAEESALEALLVDATDAIDRHTMRSFHAPTQATSRLYRPSRDGTMVDLLDDIASEEDLKVEVRSYHGAAWTETALWYPTIDNGGGIYAPGMVTGIYAANGRVFRREGQLQTIRVTARFGWPAVPPSIRRACVLLALRLHHRNSSPSGNVNFGGDMGVARILRSDPDVTKLLGPYVRHERRLGL